MVIVRDKEVTPVDVARVVETAKAINIPNDQRLLLVEPQEFVIDGHEVKEPIGMALLLWFNVEVWGRVIYTLVTW